MVYPTLKQSGYTYVRYDKKLQGHVLRNNYTEELELFYANKNVASWAIQWRNTHLEFACSLKEN